MVLLLIVIVAVYIDQHGPMKNPLPLSVHQPTTSRHPSILAFRSFPCLSPLSLLFPSPTVWMPATHRHNFSPTLLGGLYPPLLSSMFPYLYWPLNGPNLVISLLSPIWSPSFSDSANGKVLYASKQSHIFMGHVLCLLPASCWVTLQPWRWEATCFFFWYVIWLSTYYMMIYPRRQNTS